MASWYDLSFTAGEVKLLTDSAHPVGTFVIAADTSFRLGGDSGMAAGDGVALPSAPFMLTVSSPDPVYIRNNGGLNGIRVLHCR